MKNWVPFREKFLAEILYKFYINIITKFSFPKQFSNIWSSPYSGSISLNQFEITILVIESR